jgi:hypothetical protein
MSRGKTETIMFETGNTLLKIVTSYTLEKPTSLGKPKGFDDTPMEVKAMMRLAEQQLGGPAPSNVVHTLELTDLRTATSVKIMLQAEELDDLCETLSKAQVATHAATRRVRY